MNSASVRVCQFAAVGVTALMLGGTYPGGAVANDCIVTGGTPSSCAAVTNPDYLCTIEIITSAGCPYTRAADVGAAGFKQGTPISAVCTYYDRVKDARNMCVRAADPVLKSYTAACIQAAGDACTKKATIEDDQ